METLKRQYSLAKQMLDHLDAMYSIKNKESKHWLSIMNLYQDFRLIMGYNSIEKNKNKLLIDDAYDLFEDYQNELLEANIIELGDTMTDDQKHAYYYEKELMERYLRDY